MYYIYAYCNKDKNIICSNAICLPLQFSVFASAIPKTKNLVVQCTYTVMQSDRNSSKTDTFH